MKITFYSNFYDLCAQISILNRVQICEQKVYFLSVNSIKIPWIKVNPYIIPIYKRILRNSQFFYWWQLKF